ncbi:MAG TPA: hypothetical protein VJT73_11085, partial [Polyangiaceae bacterium]|nr:hypothetical protein [Polyangiaceae bacterium]
MSDIQHPTSEASTLQSGQARVLRVVPQTEDGQLGEPPAWAVEHSAELYQIRGWGEPYFRVGASGCVEVWPDPA